VSYETSPIERAARAFAYAAHLGQKYGEANYITHLDHAVDVARRFGVRAPGLIAAVYLHDTIEDTKVTFEDLVAVFDLGIARLVYAVTDKPGKNRAERHEATFPGILAVGYPAVLVKLADRLANVETSARGPNKSKLAMYRKEYPRFRAALKVVGSNSGADAGSKMWAHLDSLLDFKG
jgi:(p)ppGpp synthase/HD superfamily hydrolase